VDTTTPNLSYQYNPLVDVARDGTLGLVWSEFTTDWRNPIVFEKSSDRGQTFQRLVVVDSVLQRDTTGFGMTTSREVYEFKFGPDGTIWILWSYVLSIDYYNDRYLRLSRSTDEGESFSLLFSEERSFWGSDLTPQLAVGQDSSVFILWADRDLMCTKFLHGDMARRTDAIIPHGNYSVLAQGAMVVDSTLNVHCVWAGYWSDTYPHSYVFYSKSQDSGNTFLPPARVDTAEIYQDEPRLAVTSNGNVVVVYQTYIGQNSGGAAVFDLYSATMIDHGNGFAYKTLLADSSIAGDLNPYVIYKTSTGVLAAWTSCHWIGPFGNCIPYPYFTRSKDLGISFRHPTPIDSSLPGDCAGLAADTDGWTYSVGYAGTRGNTSSAIAISKSNVSEGVHQGVSLSAPREFRLDQNFPNPFNPSTLISFSIPKHEYVRLQVFNLLGQIVTTLVDEVKHPGTYTVIWDASTRPTGLYFYRMTAGEFMQMKKAVLVK
jgi:hypothetical protein